MKGVWKIVTEVHCEGRIRQNEMKLYTTEDLFKKWFEKRRIQNNNCNKWARGYHYETKAYFIEGEWKEVKDI